MGNIIKPVSQDLLVKLLLPEIKTKGQRYKKFQQILARPVIEGEEIESITSSGYETGQVGRQGAYVVKNLTSAKEEYIVEAKKFHERYCLLCQEDEKWSRYESLGEVWAIEVCNDLLSMLNLNSPFHIMASWESEQYVEYMDFLVTPPTYDEIYRIGRQEFFQTYKLFV